MWCKSICCEPLVQLATSNSNAVLKEVSFGVTHSDHLEKLYSRSFMICRPIPHQITSRLLNKGKGMGSACGENRNTYGVLMENLKETDYLEDPGIN